MTLIVAPSLIATSYGALSFWDYATAAPYITVDMNPVGGFGEASLEKDAIFISGHKFVGGPGTPGVLVVKRRLLKNEVSLLRCCPFVRIEANHSGLYNADNQRPALPCIIGCAGA
jgi:selenocysteine lyase/cysteine desulfurase